MALSRLLDEDPVLGIRRIFHGHGDGKTFTIETRQDVGQIVELNKREYNNADKRFGNRYMTRVGRVPLNLALKYWLTRDDTEIRRFLNLSDNRAWLVKPVVV